MRNEVEFSMTSFHLCDTRTKMVANRGYVTSQKHEIAKIGSE
jgi:hypothetical protein